VPLLLSSACAHSPAQTRGAARGRRALPACDRARRPPHTPRHLHRPLPERRRRRELPCLQPGGGRRVQPRPLSRVRPVRAQDRAPPEGAGDASTCSTTAAGRNGRGRGAFAPTSLEPTTRSCPGAAPALWRSEDGGASWSKLARGLPRKQSYFTVQRDALTIDELKYPALYFGTTTGSGSGARGATPSTASSTPSPPSTTSRWPWSEPGGDREERQGCGPGSTTTAVTTVRRCLRSLVGCSGLGATWAG